MKKHFIRIFNFIHIFRAKTLLNQPKNLPPNAKLIDQLHAMKRDRTLGVRIHF